MPLKRNKQRANIDTEQYDESSSPGKDLGRAFADGAVTALASAKEASDWNPIVKAVVGGVNEIVTLCRVSAASFGSPFLFDISALWLAISN
jgi:hypothetical protein